MRKEFLLSKADLFFRFKFPRFGRRAVYILLIYGVFYIISERGFTEKELLSCLQYIFLIVSIFFPLFAMLHWKFKRFPYKIIVDTNKRNFQFILSYTDIVKEVSFDEIDKIIERMMQLRFILKDGRKYIWHKNPKNHELEQLLSQNGLQIIDKRQSIF